MGIFAGASGDDTFVGTSLADDMYGFGGDDHLTGGAGADTMTGDDGSDTLLGGSDDDWMQAYVGGHDRFDGGEGNDGILFQLLYGAVREPGSVVEVLGGGGNDAVTMKILMVSDLRIDIDCGDGADKVTIDGYRSARLTLGGGSDLIHLVEDSANFVGVDTGVLVVSDFQAGAAGDRFALSEVLDRFGNYVPGSNPFASGHARLVQDGGDTIVQLDLDGAGADWAFADFARLEGVAASQLAAANFSGFATNGAGPVGTVMIGTALPDQLVGWAGDDRIEAREGNDWVAAGHGKDIVLGGAGSDVVYGQDGDDRLEGGLDIDFLHGGAGSDTLLGGDGNDRLSDTNGGADLFDGGAGADLLTLWKQIGSPLQTATLRGGADGDTFSLRVSNLGKAIVDGGTGNDILNVHSLRGSLDITLGAGADRVNLGKDQVGFIEGRITIRDFDVAAGGDRVIANGYFMTLFPSWDGATSPFEAGLFRLMQTGADSYWQVNWDQGVAGFVPLIKFQGIAADGLTATHLGGFEPGTIHYIGTAQADRILASAQADVIDGRTGADSMTGRGGDDFYRVDDGSDEVIESAGGGVDTVESSIDYTLPVEVERLTLAGAAVNGTGNALANLLVGNEAANRLDGRAGADRMEGGAGDDAYVVDGSGDSIVELVGAGTDTVRTAMTRYTLSANVENLVLTGGGHNAGAGNGLANNLTGNGGNNRLDGAGGADILAGGAGHDTYVVNHVADQVIEAGSSGADTVESSVAFRLPTHVEKLILTGGLGYDGTGNAGANTITGNSGGNFLNGGRGDDVIAGGAGNDRLMGNLGQDRLTGGAGDDRFYFNAASGGANADEILDFSAAEDSLYLLRSVFTRAGANGTLSASAFHQGSSAADAGDRILYDAATGSLLYDADGTGAAAPLLFATVDAGTALSHADFVIYG